MVLADHAGPVEPTRLATPPCLDLSHATALVTRTTSWKNRMANACGAPQRAPREHLFQMPGPQRSSRFSQSLPSPEIGMYGADGPT
jgi:hypothetical protein